MRNKNKRTRRNVSMKQLLQSWNLLCNIGVSERCENIHIYFVLFFIGGTPMIGIESCTGYGEKLGELNDFLP